jgi:hypothetical protein
MSVLASNFQKFWVSGIGWGTTTIIWQFNSKNESCADPGYITKK